MARNNPKKRAALYNNADPRSSKLQKLLTKGTKSQPVVVDDTQPPEVLVIASQADDFESQLRDARLKTEIAAPVEASEVATAALISASENNENGFNTRFVDTFKGVD